MTLFTSLIEQDNRFQKYSKEAEAKGFTLIRLLDGGIGEYKRNDCGHVSEKQVANIRHQKQNTCLMCSSEEHERLMEAKGLSFVRKLNSQTNLYKVTDCGHEASSTKANLAKTPNKRYDCLECYAEKEKQLLDSMGIEMLSYRADVVSCKTRPHKYALYRFKDCGHEFTYIRHAIQYGKQNCQVCTDNAAKEALKSHGYYLVGELAPIKITIGFNSCGHTRLVYRSAAVKGNCICQECKITAYKRPSKIYAIELETDTGTFIKYGYGKSVKARLREYGLTGAEVKKILFDIDVQTGNDALKIEKKVHSMFSDKRLNKEEMRKYFKNTGFSECYPKEIGSELEAVTKNLVEVANNG